MLRKINTKLVRSNDAVSAVIGVILMVAITVAIAATVFVYVNNIAQVEKVAPQIIGIESNIVNGTKIEMTGASMSTSRVRITVTDTSDSVASISTPDAGLEYDLTDETWDNRTGTLGDSADFTWIDTGGDGKIGGGDILKLTNDGGLAKGTWYVKIIDLDSGKPSMSIDIEIN